MHFQVNIRCLLWALSILFFKDLFYYSCVYMSIVALGGQKKVLDLQELELQDIVNCS